MMPARTPVPSIPSVPAAAENDLDSGTLGQVSDGERVLRQAAIGLVDKGDAACLLVALQLDQRELAVIQDVVADPGIAHQIQEQVLVDQGEAESISGNGPADGHDVR